MSNIEEVSLEGSNRGPAGAGGAGHGMTPTDIGNPDYFHKVVDCQWACPAHTPVPEYIRLIAAGRYSDAYMVNWYSNVFPGILGRTCDRPCEPACRRGRVEDEPVAHLPPEARRRRQQGRYHRAPAQGAVGSNGKRVALIGAGPASLTVARDLAPLGYELVVYNSEPRGGGMIRSQIPRFRLPESVIDEEVGYILDIGGIETRFGKRVDSLAGVLAEGYDAVFVGTGAPRGRDLDIPGRAGSGGEHPYRHRLAGERVVRPCRQDRQARDRARRRQHCDGLLPHVAPPRRRGRQGDRALRLRGDEGVPWEKEDAMHEGIPILNFLVPKEFTHGNGKLTGVRFEKVAAVYDDRGRRRLEPTGEPDQHFECDDVLVAVGQENAFPWIERDIGVVFDKHGMPVVDRDDPSSRRCPQVFFGGDSAFGPKNIIWAVAHGHEAAISIDRLCSARDVHDRPPPHVTLISQKMGIHEWSYDNEISLDKRKKVPLRGT